MLHELGCCTHLARTLSRSTMLSHSLPLTKDLTGNWPFRVIIACWALKRNAGTVTPRATQHWLSTDAIIIPGEQVSY